jgi:putative transposase
LPVDSVRAKDAGFRSACSAQRFLSSHSASYNTFNVCRHLTTASTHRILRSQAFDAWKTAVAAQA